MVALAPIVFDYFVCHASEDKPAFVRGLAQYLIKNGASVFFDELTIKAGASLSSEIIAGLAQTKTWIIVLSPVFLTKTWANAELEAILQRYRLGSARLIPINHGISHEAVAAKYPLLADVVALSSEEEIPNLAKKIFEASGFTPSMSYLSSALGRDPLAIANEGFAISIRFQLLTLLSSEFVDKYIFDLGTADVRANRISLRLVRHSDLQAALVDAHGREISLSCSARQFQRAPGMLTFQLAPSRSKIEMYINDQLASSLEAPSSFFSAISPNGGFVIFNSLELVHPCPALISFFSLARELSPQNVSDFCRLVLQLNKDLGRD